MNKSDIIQTAALMVLGIIAATAFVGCIMFAIDSSLDEQETQNKKWAQSPITGEQNE